MNIPQLLTSYRIAAAPVAAGVALAGYRDAFFILIFISLLTDLVDGPIARRLHQETSFGAKLDTIADACTLLAGIFGLLLFEAETLQDEIGWLYAFLVSYAIAAMASLAKFGVLPAYHLYLSKAAATCAALFFIWLYAVGYSPVFFMLVTGLGILANLESLVLTVRLRRFRADIVSVFAASVEITRRED